VTLPPVFTGTPKLYRDRPIDSWGHNGTGYVVKIVGDTVFVGGSFKSAVHRNQTVPRANAMAVDLSSGNLLPFTANTNGVVYGIESNGSSVFLAGDFTTVNGVPRQRVAKVDRITGQVDPTFTVSTNDYVRDLLLVGNKLYLAGAFGSVNGTNRENAAAVDVTTGKVDPQFDPNTDAVVNTVAINRAGTKVYLGGNFTLVGPAPRPFMAEVSPTTGHVQGPVFDGLTKMVRDLNVRDDGTMVYAGTRMNSGFAFDATSGKRKWRIKVDGDVQAIVQSNGYVYIGFHDGYLLDPNKRILALDPTTGVVSPSYDPPSDGYPGVVALDTDGRYLVAAGLFSRMGGQGVDNLAIFPA
jgi:outer membrane protein assembly factor BamB